MEWANRAVVTMYIWSRNIIAETLFVNIFGTKIREILCIKGEKEIEQTKALISMCIRKRRYWVKKALITIHKYKRKRNMMTGLFFWNICGRKNAEYYVYREGTC